MADRCVLIDDLLRVAGGGRRTYVLIDRSGVGAACVDVRMRLGPDWLFARRWVRTTGGPRELFRLVDRLEQAGFRFEVAVPTGGPTAVEATRGLDGFEELNVRASELQKGLDANERRIHEELFPEEHELLRRGYDWDLHQVYRDGAVLPLDPYGRILEVDAEVLFEWVRVPEESTWRRYPLERLRSLTTRST